MENGTMASGNESSSLIFLGCSSAVPNGMCLIQPSDPSCSVCFQSLHLPPDQNPNYRCNTSLLIDYCQNGSKHQYIQIDVGKTFRDQVLRWFTLHKIPRVDSIILTHEHADAVLGLDDVRAVQPFSPTNDNDPLTVYLSQHSMDSIAMKFPYLIRKKFKKGQEVRRVAQFDWKIIELMHGEDYISLGFLFGKKSRVAYISDVSHFPADTEYIISRNGVGQLDLVILDTLYKTGSHNTHFCLPQTLDAVRRMLKHAFHKGINFTFMFQQRICPKRALFIGMAHDFDQHKDNRLLSEWSRREGIPVELIEETASRFG